MLAELHQELFKLNHRKLSWLIMLLMPIYMLVIGFAMGRIYSNLLVMSCYDVSTVIMLILIIVGSTIFSMEFQNGTIINLMYHTNSRATVFFAKFLALLLYDVLLHVVAMVITVLLNIVPLINNPVSWMGIYKYHQPLVVNMFMHAGVDMVSTGLIISLICLVSCLINSNAIVIAVNALFIFMSSGLSNNLLMAHVGPWKIIRWNPFNMINLTDQYHNYATYHLTTMLSNNQLLIGTLCYTALFTMIGYLIFRKKHF